MTSVFRKIVVATVSAAALTVGATGCAELNPAELVTIDADLDAGASKEILANYPGATDIEVTKARDYPNIMKWEMPNGEKCTAFASQTQLPGQTPGELIAAPYCREI